MSKFEVGHYEHNRNHWDTKESSMKIFHLTTGEELDLDSVQYQTIYHFLVNKVNTPLANVVASWVRNQQFHNPRQGQHLPGEGQWKPVANHIPEGLYQGQLGNVPSDTRHQGQRNAPNNGFKTRTSPLFYGQQQQFPNGKVRQRVNPLFFEQPERFSQI